MDENTQKVIGKIKCPECQNDVAYDHELRLNDILECNFCGAELEIIEINSDKSVRIALVEEEK